MTEAQGKAKLQKRAMERRKALGLPVGRAPMQADDQEADTDGRIRAALDGLIDDRDAVRAKIAEYTAQVVRIDKAITAMQRLLGVETENPQKGNLSRRPRTGSLLVDRCVDALKRAQRPLSKHQLANEVGSTPESVWQTLANAEKKGDRVRRGQPGEWELIEWGTK